MPKIGSIKFTDARMYEYNGAMHLLQSRPWHTLKSKFGWSSQNLQLQSDDPPIRILFRKLPLGLKVAYVPKCACPDWRNKTPAQETLHKIIDFCQQPGVFLLKVEPDIDDTPEIAPLFESLGFTRGASVQPQASIVVDLRPSEDEILAAMKSKTRYNIRLARKKGITVREGALDDIPTFFQLNQTTAERDGFGIHSEDYYRAAYQSFAPENRALLIAEFEGEPLAALMLFAWDKRAYYLYGASSNAHRNKMPAYLLQWTAMRWAKQHGYESYDLWGIPNAPEAELEAEFTKRNDGLWGVYRFKRGFGGTLTYSAGVFDFAYSKIGYFLFTKFLARRKT